jgi:hypothetical protein
MYRETSHFLGDLSMHQRLSAGSIIAGLMIVTAIMMMESGAAFAEEIYLLTQDNVFSL